MRPTEETCRFKSVGVMKRKQGLSVARTYVPFPSPTFSLQVLLTLDDDLDVVRRDQIPVF